MSFLAFFQPYFSSGWAERYSPACLINSSDVAGLTPISITTAPSGGGSLRSPFGNPPNGTGVLVKSTWWMGSEGYAPVSPDSTILADKDSAARQALKREFLASGGSSSGFGLVHTSIPSGIPSGGILEDDRSTNTGFHPYWANTHATSFASVCNSKSGTACIKAFVPRNCARSLQLESIANSLVAAGDPLPDPKNGAAI